MFDFYTLIPILILSFGGCAFLLCGKLLEDTRTTGWFTMFILAATLGATLSMSAGNPTTGLGLSFDPFSKLLGGLIALAALLSVMSGSVAVHEEKVERLTEYYFLVLMTVAGALIMVGAADFLMLFIGLEVASLALYCLCGARVTKSASSESSLKYFLMGCFSSAFFLYGIALWYGVTGSLQIANPTLVSVYTTPVLMVSFLFLLVGLAFKVGLAPFHLWVPDVYQGAPTSVTTFMSCVIKIAAFGALIKISMVSFLLPNEWASRIMWVIAALAMTLGNLAALQQRSIKRMLAYSSVAQAGYMLMGLVAVASGPSALAALVYYLIGYCAMSIGAFSVLSAIGPDADDIDDLKGLGARSPLLAVCMTLFFLALAGLPPSLAGLMGKVYLFSSSLAADFTGLAIIAVLNSALACAYYFRIPMAVWFQKGRESDAKCVCVSGPAGFSIVFCAVAVVVLGFIPERVFGVALSGVSFLASR